MKYTYRDYFLAFAKMAGLVAVSYFYTTFFSGCSTTKEKTESSVDCGIYGNSKVYGSEDAAIIHLYFRNVSLKTAREDSETSRQRLVEAGTIDNKTYVQCYPLGN